jgi:hypothetical protein
MTGPISKWLENHFSPNPFTWFLYVYIVGSQPFTHYVTIPKFELLSRPITSSDMPPPTQRTSIARSSSRLPILSLLLIPAFTHRLRDPSPSTTPRMDPPIHVYASEWGTSSESVSAILKAAFEDEEMRLLHCYPVQPYRVVKNAVESTYIHRSNSVSY